MHGRLPILRWLSSPPTLPTATSHPIPRSRLPLQIPSPQAQIHINPYQIRTPRFKLHQAMPMRKPFKNRWPLPPLPVAAPFPPVHHRRYPQMRLPTPSSRIWLHPSRTPPRWAQDGAPGTSRVQGPPPTPIASSHPDAGDHPVKTNHPFWPAIRTIHPAPDCYLGTHSCWF